MTVLWISFAALYALGMLWLAYQIRTAPVIWIYGARK